ncbi:winged helix-turn-helix transcriptional regulator [Nonomuraea sp. NPDC049714]|uniref:winged helix-turn-helix transcriptional regulator n=1 Tax=Nonomuraea sp. NPDC049714 TaxID=3364357 RepID=UPI0037A899C9
MTEFAGRKWNAAILMSLRLGHGRFSELRAHVEGISDRLLSSRLQELTREGLVHKDVTPTYPVQVRYSLTDAGHELIQVLHPLVGWAHRWPRPSDPRPPHADGHASSPSLAGRPGD